VLLSDRILAIKITKLKPNASYSLNYFFDVQNETYKNLAKDAKYSHTFAVFINEIDLYNKPKSFAFCHKKSLKISMKLFVIFFLLLGRLGTLDAQKLARRPILGVDVTEKDQSVLISKVAARSPAEKAGLKVGDEFLSINEQPIHSFQELVQTLKLFKTNEKIKVKVRREQKVLNITAQLEEAPKEIVFRNRTIYGEVNAPNAILRSIITVPEKAGKYPAVIFVQGVGCFPIDTPFDTTYGHVQVLRHLSRNNIVTMRVEKSGVGDSQGIACEKMDFQTEVAHFTEALKTLKTYPFVDKENVFIIGHSLGGVLAPIIAQKEGAKGIIVYGTIGQNWTNYLIDSRRAMALRKGEDFEDVEEWTKTVTDCSVRFFMQKQPMDSIFKVNADCQDFLKKFAFRSPEYWYQLSEVNVAQQWKEYEGYVLSIWGEADKTTFATEHQLIADIVNKKHPQRGTFIKVSRADHKMCLRNPQDTDKERDFNPQIAESIFEWIHKVSGGL
jgi:dienelactone hydrolase